MLFKEYSRVFSPKKFFPSGPLFHVLKIKTLSESSYSKKPPLLWKNPGCALIIVQTTKKIYYVPAKFISSSLSNYTCNILSLRKLLILHYP